MFSECTETLGSQVPHTTLTLLLTHRFFKALALTDELGCRHISALRIPDNCSVKHDMKGTPSVVYIRTELGERVTLRGNVYISAIPAMGNLFQQTIWQFSGIIKLGTNPDFFLKL